MNKSHDKSVDVLYPGINQLICYIWCDVINSRVALFLSAEEHVSITYDSLPKMYQGQY